MIWYEAKVNDFYTPEEDWTWNGKPLTKFPKSVSAAFGKYSVEEDGKTWTKQPNKIGDSGAVQVPKLSLAEHNIPSIMVPSKTDWFSNNTKEGREGIKGLGITEDEVNMMQSDGVRGVYSTYETLEEKLKLQYPEQKRQVKSLIKALKKAEELNLLRW